MNIITIYRKFATLAMLVFLPVFLPSCNMIWDDPGDCGLYLEFIYDHNMEFADSFGAQLSSVDVFVFDEQGKYLFSKHANTEELIDGKKMRLGEELSLGQNYNIVTVGNLSDSFSFSDAGGKALTTGTTSIEDVRLALKRSSGNVSHEFPGIWLGEVLGVEFRGKSRVWPVSLIKETNRFNLALARVETEVNSRAGEDVPYTFEIVTPEGGVYCHDNTRILDETVTYKPYMSQAGTDPAVVSIAKINTMRLFNDIKSGYRFIIKESGTGRNLWNYGLMDLLVHIKPDTSPDGSSLSMQEFLDRQSEWNITLLYIDGERPDGSYGFLSVGLVVADWILWINDIEV